MPYSKSYLPHGKAKVRSGNVNYYTTTGTLGDNNILTGSLSNGTQWSANLSSLAGGGGGSGTVAPSPQYEVPFYSVAGTSSTITGTSAIVYQSSNEQLILTSTQLGNASLILKNTQATSTVSGLEIYNESSQVFQIGHNNNTDENYVWGTGDIPLKFATSGTERMRITADGNVGIGLTGPNAKLDVLSATTQQRWSYDGTYYTDITVANDGDTEVDAILGELSFKTSAGGKRIRLDSKGDVQADLGGSAGTYIFKVVDSSQNWLFTVYDDGRAGLHGADSTLEIKERASAPAHTATYGKLWVKNDNPANLYYTDDDDNDIALTDNGSAAGGGDVSKVGTPANTQVGVWTGDGTIEGNSNLTYAGASGISLLQGADEAGIVISGYDDKSSDWLKLHVKSDGIARARASLSLQAQAAESIYVSAGEHLYLDNGTRDTYSTIFRDGTGEYARFKNARLGIGSTNPGYPLHVVQNSGDTYGMYLFNNGSKGIYFGDTNNNGTGFGKIGGVGGSLFLGSTQVYTSFIPTSDSSANLGTSSRRWSYSYFRYGQFGYNDQNDENSGSGGYVLGVSGNADRHPFMVKAYGDAGTPSFIVTSGSNVGVGLSAPDKKFVIRTGGSRDFKFYDYDMTYESSLGIRAKNGGYLGLVTEGANDVFISTNGFSNKRLVVDSAGLVGIGTTNPSTKLNIVGTGYGSNTTGSALFQLYGTDDIGPTLTFRNNQSEYGSIYYGDTGAWVPQGTMGFIQHRDNAASDVKMVIASGGNVGIGTTNPIQPLHVLTSANDKGILIDVSDNTHEGRLIFGDVASNGVGHIGYNHSMETMRFTVGGFETVRMAADANYKKLFLGADSTLGFYRYGNRMDFYVQSQPRIQLDSGTLFASNATGAPSIDLYPSVGTATYGFYGDTDTGLDRTGADTLVLLTAGTDALTIDSSQVTTFTNTPVVGTMTSGDNTTKAASTAFVTAAVTAAGGGDVSKVGTPVDNQIGVWTGDGTIEGDANLTFDGTNRIDLVPSNAEAKIFLGAGNVVLAYTGSTGKLNSANRTLLLGNSGAEIKMLNGTNDSMHFYTNGSSTTGTERLTILSGGNVGIGTTNPNYKLDVYDDTNGFVGRLKNTSSNGYVLRLEASDSTLDFQTDHIIYSYNMHMGDDNRNLYLRTLGQKLGVGTSNPATAFHVSGTNIVSRFQDTTGGAFTDIKRIAVETSYAATVAGGHGQALGTTADANSDLWVNGARYFRFRHATGSTTDGATTYMSGSVASSSFLEIKTTGNNYSKGAVISGPNELYIVTGDKDLTFNSGRQLTTHYDNEYVIYNDTGNPVFHIRSGSSAAIEFEGDGDMRFKSAGTSTKMSILTGGNVGIGTTSPSYNLDVNGTVNVSSVLYLGDSDTKLYRSSNDLYIRATSDILLNDTGGNVGIGTSSPARKLEVNYGASSGYMRIVGQSKSLLLGQDSVGAAIYQEDNAPMYFATNNAERMRILADGKVGIGTTAPAYELDISSTDPQIGLTDTNGYSYYIMAQSDKFWIGNSTAGTTPFVVDSAGKVGIGTTNPSTKLEVAGDFNLGSSVSLKENATIATIEASAFQYGTTESTYVYDIANSLVQAAIITTEANYFVVAPRPGVNAGTPTTISTILPDGSSEVGLKVTISQLTSTNPQAPLSVTAQGTDVIYEGGSNSASAAVTIAGYRGANKTFLTIAAGVWIVVD